MRQPRTPILLLLLFLLTLLVGVWQFVSPWVIGFAGSWNAVVWSSVWTSAVVIGVSAVALVVVAAASVYAALRAAENRKEEEDAAAEEPASS
jgi:uncharacterized membrane protein (DUF485 family)